MYFGSAMEAIQVATLSTKINNNPKGMRLPQWSPDVIIRCYQPIDSSLMTAPYLYVESRFGRVSWIPTQIEMFSTNWELVE